MIDPETLLAQRRLVALLRGEPPPKPKTKPHRKVKRCSFPRCVRGHYALGLCTAHYAQRLRGTTLHPLAAPALRRADPEVIERARARLAARGIAA